MEEGPLQAGNILPVDLAILHVSKFCTHNSKDFSSNFGTHMKPLLNLPYSG